MLVPSGPTSMKSKFWSFVSAKFRRTLVFWLAKFSGANEMGIVTVAPGATATGAPVYSCVIGVELLWAVVSMVAGVTAVVLEAGPTAVHTEVLRVLFGSWVKTRKLTVSWSARS